MVLSGWLSEETSWYLSVFEVLAVVKLKAFLPFVSQTAKDEHKNLLGGSGERLYSLFVSSVKHSYQRLSSYSSSEQHQCVKYLIAHSQWDNSPQQKSGRVYEEAGGHPSPDFKWAARRLFDFFLSKTDTIDKKWHPGLLLQPTVDC